MRRTEVHKFGGTSVAGAERLRCVAELAANAAAESRLVLVTSAMAGVTDSLVSAGAAAAAGDSTRVQMILAELQALHENVLASLNGSRDAAAADVRQILDELAATLQAVSALRESTARSQDRILATGERLAVRLLAAALQQRGFPAVAIDASSFLETDDRFGEASPLEGVADHTIRAALEPHLAAGAIPVVTGFTGCAPDGSVTTLGRGGSDLTATVLAAALTADEVTIWTDVDGVYTADPRIVPEAQRIPQLHFREAAELSFYGAKVLHPRTLIPVATRGIPVHIRDSLVQNSERTTVDTRFTPGSHPVKAISAMTGQSLISVEGKGMAGIPGVAARLFTAIARQGISVTMISQSSSESSITLVVPTRESLKAELALKREFRADITHGAVEEVTVRGGVGLVAAVGLGMAHTPGVSARVFGALGKAGISVLAIAQGSSELNISLAVDADRVADAVRAIHKTFELHRLDTGTDDPDSLDLLLFGCGQIGRALVDLVENRRAHVFQRFGLNARIVGIADRSGYLLRPGGIPADEVRTALQAKTSGHPLSTVAGATAAEDVGAMVRHALRYRLVRPVLVDVSDAPDTDLVFQEALRLGCDVVTANKKALAGSFEAFQALSGAAADSGRIFRAEATVGAGLPVVDTLEMLMHTGDRLLAAEGSLSGTLGFLMTRIEEGMRFSEAVEEAVQLGYTEPDPVADLSGVDVARKAVILGRLSGLVDADVPIRLTGLVDADLAGLPRQVLFERLRAYDQPIADRVANARSVGKVLRYTAQVGRGTLEVGPKEVPAESPIGSLRGSDNLILFRSERYQSRPLVVIGPGAGVDVTAMGVLSDVLRVAAERR
jgi:aspartokinase/homoserine dehydrogenase 1